MKDLVNLFFESGMLNRIKRTGPFAVNSRNHETVAEHCHRSMLIAYVLAKLEKVDTEKVLLMMLVHDLPEARIWDHNLITARYINTNDAEVKVLSDQTKALPPEIKRELNAVFKEFEEKKTKESVVAKDADLLECAVEAKELIAQGFTDMQDWINNIRKRLKTESAKKLLSSVEELHPNKWWEGLKNVPAN